LEVVDPLDEFSFTLTIGQIRSVVLVTIPGQAAEIDSD
jgi:hypothetical protein